MGDWKEVPLRELVEIYDGLHATPKKTAIGPVFLGISNLERGRLDLASVEHLSETDYKRWTRRITPMPNDIVFSYETRIGEAAVIPPGLRCCLGRRLGLLRVRDKSTDPLFLLYAYLGPEFQDTLRARTVHGSTVDRILLEEMPEFQIRVPRDVTEQQAIAGILGSLDQKIELNRRMNVTLEGIARALFKSWFVDFDPVRAGSEDRATGLPEPITELFPCSFTDSQIGEIPKGWSAKPYAEIIEVLGGGTPRTAVEDYWDGEIPWFSVVDAPSQSDVWIVDTQKKITREGLSNSSTQILPVGTTIISARGTVGKLGMVGVPMAMNQSCNGLHGTIGQAGIFNYFTARNLVSTLQRQAHGSVFDTITRDTFSSLSVVIPSVEIVDAFESKIQPFLQRIRLNLLQSRTLALLRDTLLPNLLSCELPAAMRKKAIKSKV